MSVQTEYIKISSGKNPKIKKAHFMSIEFEQEGFKIVFIPSIGLSAYGSTYEEAREMMKVSIHEAMTAFNKCTPAEMFAELKSYGWERNVFYTSDLSKSAHIDKEGILRDFDLDLDTPIQERLVTV